MLHVFIVPQTSFFWNVSIRVYNYMPAKCHSYIFINLSCANAEYATAVLACLSVCLLTCGLCQTAEYIIKSVFGS